MVLLSIDKNSGLKFLRQLIVLIIGDIILSFGISMYLKANLGSDPVTTFVDGVSIVSNISVGRASQIVMLVVLIAIFILDKQYIGIGTVINAFLIGGLLNLFMGMNFGIYSSLFPRVLVLFIGVLANGIGLSVVLLSNLGQGAVDSLMSILKDKFSTSVKTARIILDIILVVIGVLLGAPIGLGTIIGSIFNGVVMNKMVNLFNKYF